VEKNKSKNQVYFGKYIPKKCKFWKTFSEYHKGKIGISGG
jgi:putative component of membrane protein insertase Oxa1/YidC/SpoIIIJ protein YidD